jgi:hypothetical protein
VNLADAFHGKSTPSTQPAAVHPLLYLNVRLGFELQVAFNWVLAVVVLERSLDVYGVRIMSLNKIRVVAVHRAHEIGKRGQNGGRQAVAETSGLLGKIEC